jgi:PAS domain S-box-containing protein
MSDHFPATTAARCASAQRGRDELSLLSGVLDALPTQVAILDGGGVIHTVNGRWRAWGRERGVVEAEVGANYLELCDAAARRGDGVARARAEGLRAVLEGSRSTFSIEFPCGDSGGGRHLVERATRFGQGEESWVVVMHEDVTQQKEVEVALRRSEARFRSLIENAADVISILDEEGRFRYESPSAKRVLGAGDAERIGQSFFDFIHADDLPRVMRDFTRALDQPGRKVVLEFRWRAAGAEIGLA